MRGFGALVQKEWLVLGRDRHGLLVLFVMPALFILIMSLALRDALTPGRSGALRYYWLDEDRSYFALALADALAARPEMKQLAAGGEGDVHEGLRRGDAAFALRVRPGLTERIAAGADDPAARTALVTVYLSPSAPPQSRLLFLAQVRGALASVQSEYLMEDSLGVPHAEAARLRGQIDPTQLPLEEHYVGSGEAAAAPPNAVQQSVPAWVVFAMFFVVLPIAVSVLAEREQGNLQRLALLNVTPAQLLASKFPAYYAVNFVQFVAMLAVGVWVVPRFGGDRLTLGDSPLGLWLIMTALSAAAIGFALLIAVVARSTVQATTLGGVANLLLGAVGGVMVPKLVMPPAMQAATLVSPMSWALEGCWDILLRGGGVADILPESVALAGFGAVCYFIAVFLFPKTEA